MFAEDQYYEQVALRDAYNTVSNPKAVKKETNRIKDFLHKIDQQHNSEDQGIEDYNIGGYHPVHIGEVLLKRYVVIQKLGWGHFSTVWLCKDFKYKTYVAVKIQKSSPHYMEAAFDEVEILQKVQMHYKDPAWDGKNRDDTHVVGLLNAFIHKTHYGNHFCMVFEILRCNLLDILKRYEYEGVPLDICQQISRQVLKGLDYLHRICGVIHTDLKPENVMVCLTSEQLRQIVENGQLMNNQLFAERTKMIQEYLGFDIKHQDQQNIDKIQDNSRIDKIEELEEKLKTQKLTKNQKKNLKKRIRKQKQKENQNEEQEESVHIKQNINVSEPNKQSAKSIQELFDLKKGKIQLNRGGKLKLPIRVKIADLGNACWKHHQFSTEIQTRQYRSPQVILGQTYNETADIWSFGCMMYEMLTGDLLFQPRKTEDWGKNDDHLAQMQELLGTFDPIFLARSSKMKKYFMKNGKMKKFPSLNHYSLDTVLQLKNKIIPQEAKKFAQFLIQTLIPQPEKRWSARKMLDHGWLKQNLPHQNFKMSDQDHRQLKHNFYSNQSEFRTEKTKNLHSQASCSGNEMEEFYQVEPGCKKKKYKIADIRLVDRSFTDLGYIGYCQGIDLQQLDACKNWQFS